MAPPTTASPAPLIIGQLERFTCAVARRESAHGLNPAQWAALRYIAQPPEDGAIPTISGFARLRLTTPSSASQTVSSLVRVGLVARAAAPDKRQRPLELTPQGQLLLKRDPLRHLAGLIAGLSSKSLIEFSEVLDVVLRALAL
jgi:DNA-binding MarR family transcriptional regulator